MFFVQHPSPEVIERFVRDSRQLPLSYGPVGTRSQAALPLG
jgi:hypothetical protein